MVENFLGHSLVRALTKSYRAWQKSLDDNRMAIFAVTVENWMSIEVTQNHFYFLGLRIVGHHAT